MVLTFLQNMAENNIGAEGLIRICELLSSNNRIVSVDLSGNYLTDKEAPYICDMLQVGYRPV